MVCYWGKGSCPVHCEQFSPILTSIHQMLVPPFSSVVIRTTLILSNGYLRGKNTAGPAACTVQFSHSVLSDSLRPHGLQHSVLPVHYQLLEFTQTMSIETVMPSNYLIFCHPLLLPSMFPSIRAFSNESALHIRWPKYWSFGFNITPCNEYSGLISFRIDWLGLLAGKGLSRVFSNTTVQKHQFFGAQLSL